MRHPYRRSRLPRLLASTSRPRCSHSRMKSSSNPLLRLWVKTGPDGPEIRLPLYPRKRTQVGHRAMSVSCRFCCRNRRTDGAGRLMPFFEAIHCHPLDCAGDLRSTLLTLHAYAAHKGASGGGRATNLASLRRFCAIAANVNSNWAPHGPRNRSRPSRRIRFKCANSISTRFLSRDDCLNASVLASARATSRASS